MLLSTAVLALLVANAPDSPRSTVVWTWRAPRGCPDEATTRRELNAAAQTACSLDADAQVEKTDAGWRLELRLRRQGRAEERTLTAATCKALADAVVVIVAVACIEDALSAVPEPPVAAVPPPPAEAPQVEPGGSTGVPPEATELPEERRATEAPLVLRPAGPGQALIDRRRVGAPIAELGLRGGVAWAPTHAPAANLGLAVRMRWRWVDLVLVGGYTSGRTSRYAQMSELGVKTRLAHAGLAVCPALDWGDGRARGRGGLCAEVEVGAMFGTGVGAPTNRTGARPWVALGLAPVLGWFPNPRISVGLQLDLLLGVVRPAFALEGLDPLVRADALGVRLHTTLYIRLF